MDKKLVIQVLESLRNFIVSFEHICERDKVLKARYLKALADIDGLIGKWQ